jgi:anti-sigma regulatory factor (Ser/Thr protein kinase)
MTAVRLFALLIYTFGTFAYGAMLALWVGALGRLGWGGRESRSAVSGREVDMLNGALLAISFLWFQCNVAALVASLTPRARLWQADVALIVLAFCFPPLIMHVSWAEVAAAGDARVSRGWRLALWPAYAICAAIPAWSLAVIYFTSDGPLYRLVDRLLGSALSVAFIAAALYCIVLVTRRRPQEGARGHLPRRPIVLLFGCMLTVFTGLFVLTTFTGDHRPMAAFGAMIEVAAKSLPLVFMFVTTYYENRFQFFDLFVKRGLGFLLMIVALTIWLALMLPFVGPLATTWAAPWIFAITLVPVVAVIPWLYARGAVLLDRRWLGRRYTAVQAITHFIGSMRSATNEAQLCAQAQRGLAEIFSCRADVVLGAAAPAPEGTLREIPVRSGGHVVGRFVMGPRTSDAPYFSEDIILLESLADVFAHVLENLHLQERKLEQEHLAQELSLHASRSELKALRAQINPHFLFNALNSIAGLIHRDPDVADRTIEQLADVFRYALRGAESEWALLEDELDFARAYLDVERARFGDRLRAEVRTEGAVHAVRVPTMMLQTLVENAVKHGVASVRGPASVVVTAREVGGRLMMLVSDNGPGFHDSGAATPERLRGGYGLVNIRQRLEGYFGSAATLSIERSEGVTTVSISLPLAREEPRARAEEAAR